MLTLLVALTALAEPLGVEPVPIPAYAPALSAEPELPDWTEKLTGGQKDTFVAWQADPTPANHAAAYKSIKGLLDIGGTEMWLAYAELQKVVVLNDLVAMREANERNDIGPMLSCEGLTGGTAKLCATWLESGEDADALMAKLDKGASKLNADGRLMRAQLHGPGDPDAAALYGAVAAKDGTYTAVWSQIGLAMTDASADKAKALERLAPLKTPDDSTNTTLAIRVLTESYGGPEAKPDMTSVYAALKIAVSRASSPMDRALALKATVQTHGAAGDDDGALAAVIQFADQDEPAALSARANLILALTGWESAGRFARAEKLGDLESSTLGTIGLAWESLKNGRPDDARRRAEAVRPNDKNKEAEKLLAWVMLAEGYGWPAELTDVAQPEPSAESTAAYAELWRSSGPTRAEDGPNPPSDIAAACAARARLLSPSIAGKVDVHWDQHDEPMLTVNLEPEDGPGAVDLPACLTLWLPVDKELEPYDLKVVLGL